MAAIARKKRETVRCCTICDDCENCYSPTLFELRDLMYSIDCKIANYATARNKEAMWGYGKKPTISFKDIKRLGEYKRVVKRYYHNLRIKTDQCLCPSELQTVKDKILGLVDIRCCTAADRSDIFTDASGFDAWVVANPGCVTYNVWGQSACNINPEFEILVTKISNKCELFFDVFVKYEGREEVAKLIAMVEKAKCEMKVNITLRKTSQCKKDFDILIKKHDCKFSLETYVKLLECNMSFQLIAELKKCGYEVGYNVKKQCPEVKINGKFESLDVLGQIAGKAVVIDQKEIKFFDSIYE